VTREIQLRLDQDQALRRAARAVWITPSALLRQLIDEHVPGLAQPIPNHPKRTRRMEATHGRT
jgi:hypothetical protein